MEAGPQASIRRDESLELLSSEWGRVDVRSFRAAVQAASPQRRGEASTVCREAAADCGRGSAKR